MPDRIGQKWRPPLLLVLGGTLGAVLALPLAGLLALRVMIPVFGFRHSALMIAAVILLVTAILGYLLWRLLLRPVRALAAHAHGVRTGEVVAPPLHYGTSELGDLGQAVLDMAATLQNREAAIRTYSDHVTHEMKTPLTAIRGAAEMLEVRAADRPLVEAILAATARMEVQLGILQRSAAAREPGHHGVTTLGAVVPALRATFAPMQIVARGDAQPLPLAAEGLDIVLRQLLQNAVAHGATVVTLTATLGALRIEDDGRGISDGNRDRIFDPFFTTRREAGGTGMGLAIARNVLTAHGAAIELLPSDAGAAFAITFGR
jgi:two-component system, OmpR family, sensor kinase